MSLSVELGLLLFVFIFFSQNTNYALASLINRMTSLANETKIDSYNFTTWESFSNYVNRIYCIKCIYIIIIIVTCII